MVSLADRCIYRVGNSTRYMRGDAVAYSLEVVDGLVETLEYGATGLVGERGEIAFGQIADTLAGEQ